MHNQLVSIGDVALRHTIGKHMIHFDTRSNSYYELAYRVMQRACSVSISNGFPYSGGGGVADAAIDCDGDTTVAPDAASSDDDDDGGDADPDPARRYLKSPISCGKHRSASATVGDLTLSPELTFPTRPGCANGIAYPPLELINRPTVPTAQAAYYLDRRPQTMRIWAMRESPIKPLRINGRLAWPVSELRRMLGVK